MDQITTAAALYTPPETSIIHQTQASFTTRELPQPVYLVQYDDTVPVLAVALYANSSPYTVPEGAAVNIRMDKRDGHYVYNPALGLDDTRTVAYIAVTQQMSTGAGTYHPIIEVVISGGVAGTAALTLQFDKNPVPESAIESTDEYATIQQLAAQAQAAAEGAGDSAAAAANSASAAATSAAESQTSAENAAESAQSAGINANTAQASAQAASTSATQAAASADAAAASEAAASQYAEEAKEVSQKALGYYVTADALRAAHPTGQPGNWAIVGNPDGIWVWDVEGNDWVNSGQSIELSDYYTKPQTDAQINAAKGTVFLISVPASGWQGDSAPYTNTVQVAGITADTILSSVQLAPGQVGIDSAETASTQWSYLNTQNGAVQFVAETEKPTADFAVMAWTSQRLQAANDIVVPPIDIAALTKQILLAAYPVGSIYPSFDSTSPEDLFGGTWERLYNVVLYAVDDAHEVGETGGEEEHTLTIQEMPSHSHTINYSITASAGTAQPHILSAGNALVSTNSTGGGQPHNNMMPFVRVYMWRRTA